MNDKVLLAALAKLHAQAGLPASQFTAMRGSDVEQ